MNISTGRRPDQWIVQPFPNPCFQCVGSQEFAVAAVCAASWNTEVERASGQLLAILQADKCTVAAPIKVRIEGESLFLSLLVSLSVLPVGFLAGNALKC